MGSNKSSKPIAPPKAPPPPAEDVSAEVIAPSMQQEAARRSRMSAYVTRGQRMGSGGQLLGASPIQLANIRAATQTAKATPLLEKKLTDFGTIPVKKSKSPRRNMAYEKRKNRAIAQRKSAYDKYLKQRQQGIYARNESISPEGGMVI
tara:strand:- start:217 stop:660 length:444 start_codon:yes stop_codon:yes gene_type:complete